MNMNPLCTKAGGACEAQLDMCRLLPTPVVAPFVNLADSRNATGTSDKILAQNKEVLTFCSRIPFSVGAPPTAEGVVSRVVNSVCWFMTASERVYADGLPVIMLTAETAQNGCVPNCFGFQCSPSQDVAFTES